MSVETPNAVLALRRAFSSVKAPDRITQEAYDSTPQHLRRLAKLQVGTRAESKDLWEYTQDLLYGKEIQGSLLAYVLPFCLEAWREDLRGLQTRYAGFVEYLYPVLANCHVFDTHLSPKQSSASADFIRQTILEEIDGQRGLTYKGSGARPYRWFGALTSYGVLLPDVENLWFGWWSIDTLGKAVAAVQYISCLMYPATENPVFAPWTPDGGGGPPCLWQFEGHLYNHRWLDPNVAFLAKKLTSQRVRDVLHKAAEVLGQEPEHAVALEVLADLPLCIETLEARCVELPRILETMHQTPLAEWTQ